ncbi:RNA polymerase sigma factor [Phenylobacterium sp.]|uniref:RNA polymerase sigma factor n=1 Tax=Phenylobacterium sp. TaxID=1871053 RepID=UPI002737DE08|nr:sigma-70 family RNA polymerase sigma factor [Phenylobacterium sp.]MDP3868390.1 sigma-70 family RNA polymerase sigma factor [Phenylobacterium sp.]
MKPTVRTLRAIDPSASGGGEAPITASFLREAEWLARTLRQRFKVQGAEDIVQETYLRLATQTDVQHPRALLLRVAVNIARDQLRRAIVRDRHAAQAIRFGGTLLSPADQAETLLLKQIVLSLPAADREIFILSRFRGLTYDEIALHSGLSVKTVEWRMSRSLAHCAKLLRDTD